MKTKDDEGWNPEGKPCDKCKQNPWTHQLMIGEYRYNLKDFWMDSDLSLNLCLTCEKKIVRDIAMDVCIIKK